MLAIGKYALQGRLQAALMVSLFAILAWIFPPFACLSAAVVVLVALQQPVVEALLVLVVALLVVMLFAAVLGGNLQHGAILLISFCLPAFLTALLLKKTAVLAYALMFLFVLAAIWVLAVFAIYTEPAAFWHRLLAESAEWGALQEKLQWKPEQAQSLLQTMARLMTGLLAAGISMNTALALFVGRSWQATLFRPGAFQIEFHGLRYGKTVAVLLAALLAAALVSGSDLLASMLMAAVPVYALQALAMLHAVVKLKKWSTGGLAVLYVTLFILPQTVFLLVLVAFMDAWLDIRARLQRA